MSLLIERSGALASWKTGGTWSVCGAGRSRRPGLKVWRALGEGLQDQVWRFAGPCLKVCGDL